MTTPDPVPADVVAAVREVLVAAKRDAGPRAVLLTNHVIDRAARPIARLLVRLVDAAVEARMGEDERCGTDPWGCRKTKGHPGRHYYPDLPLPRETA